MLSTGMARKRRSKSSEVPAAKRRARGAEQPEMKGVEGDEATGEEGGASTSGEVAESKENGVGGNEQAEERRVEALKRLEQEVEKRNSIAQICAQRREALMELDEAQLKAECEDLAVKSMGTKGDLVARLMRATDISVRAKLPSRLLDFQDLARGLPNDAEVNDCLFSAVKHLSIPMPDRLSNETVLFEAACPHCSKPCISVRVRQIIEQPHSAKPHNLYRFMSCPLCDMKVAASGLCQGSPSMCTISQ